MASLPFRFKKFSVGQEGAAHPVGTDAILLGAWADIENCTRILDVGTGTGVIALMLAQRLDTASALLPEKGRAEWHITAVEIHPPSAALARRNFAASPWSDRFQVVELPVQEFAQQTDSQFDLIVSNPPFFSETTFSPDPTRRLGRHTASLSPGALLDISKQLLTEAGRLCVVLPLKEGRRLCEQTVSRGLYCTEEVEVYTRPKKSVERLLLRFERDPFRFVRRKLDIYADNAGVEYSMDFRRFTEDFYL